MKKPIVLIVGAAAGALVLAGVGASAHSALSFTKTAHSGVVEATSEPSETPEPTETPEATATPEPTETPEATQAPETENADTDQDNDDQGEDANDD